MIPLSKTRIRCLTVDTRSNLSGEFYTTAAVENQVVEINAAHYEEVRSLQRSNLVPN